MMRNGSYRSKKKNPVCEAIGNYGFDSDSDDDSSTVSFYDICCGYRGQPGPSYTSTNQPTYNGQGSKYILGDRQENLVTTYTKKNQPGASYSSIQEPTSDGEGSRYILSDTLEEQVSNSPKKNQCNELNPALKKGQSVSTVKYQRSYPMDRKLTNLNPKMHLLKEQQRVRSGKKTFSFINQGKMDKKQQCLQVQDTMIRSRSHTVPVDGMLKLPKICGMSLTGDITDNKTITNQNYNGMTESKLKSKTRHIQTGAIHEIMKDTTKLSKGLSQLRLL